MTQVELIALTRVLEVRGCRPMLEDGAALGATRVVATGDDPDDEVVAAQLAALCELAAEFGMSVDLEFMPFRCVATLPQALDVLERAGQPNARDWSSVQVEMRAIAACNHGSRLRAACCRAAGLSHSFIPVFSP